MHILMKFQSIKQCPRASLEQQTSSLKVVTQLPVAFQSFYSKPSLEWYNYKKTLGCRLIFNILSPIGIIIVPSTVTYRVCILYFISYVVCQLRTLNSSKQGVIKACPGNYRAGQQSYKGIQLSVSTQFLIVYAPGNFQKRVTLYTHAKMVLKFQAWQNK